MAEASGLDEAGGLRMKTMKQRLYDALTTDGQSYAELAAKIGGNPAISALNKNLRKLEADGLAVRCPADRGRFSGSKPVDRLRRPRVLWRLA
jgi:biotin operon repressor